MASSALRFRLGRIPVEIPVSGLVGVVIIAILWAPSFYGADGRANYWLAVAFAVILYAVILVHELAHAGAATVLGFPVRGITLWILGGYTVFEHPRRSPWREAFIAVVGPLSTLLIALACYLARDHVGSAYPLVAAVGVASLFLGVFNLLPGLPLDGGMVLSNVVWALSGSQDRGVFVGAWAGRVIAVAVGVAPLFTTHSTQAFDPQIITGLLLALFLWSGASRALLSARVERQLPQVAVQPLTRRSVSVAHDLPLAEALRRLTEEQAGAIVVLDGTGRPAGIVHEAAVSAVPLDRRPWVAVSSVSRTLGTDEVLPLELSGVPLLERLRATEAPELLVVRPDGTTYGVLVRADVERMLTGMARGRRTGSR